MSIISILKRSCPPPHPGYSDPGSPRPHSEKKCSKDWCLLYPWSISWSDRSLWNGNNVESICKHRWARPSQVWRERTASWVPLCKMCTTTSVLCLIKDPPATISKKNSPEKNEWPLLPPLGFLFSFPVLQIWGNYICFMMSGVQDQDCF